MEKSEILSKIKDGVVQIQATWEGEVIRKEVTLESYIALLNNSVEEGGNIRLGKLPIGYYDASILSLDKSSFSCVAIRKSCRFVAKYYEAEFVVPYPALAFAFTVKKGNLIKSLCFAVKEEDNISDNTMLYHFPYANVYENGNICWGTNKLPEIRKLEELDVLVDMFFGAPYNEDLFVSSHAGELGASLMECFHRVKKNKIFPTDVLEPTEKTIGDLL